MLRTRHNVRTNNEFTTDKIQVQSQTTEDTLKGLENLPKCHLLQLKYRGPDSLPPIREKDHADFPEGCFSHNRSTCIQWNKNIYIANKNIWYSQPVWLVCLLIHQPGCFWKWASGFWTPPHSQCPSPAGYTAGRLKKLPLAAPRLYLTVRGVGIKLSLKSCGNLITFKHIE